MSNGRTTSTGYIPLIDFQSFVASDASPAERQKTAKAILHAFTTSGFLYLTNHGVANALIQQTFKHSADFFARPQAEKDALAWESAKSNRGYTGMGREKVVQGEKDAVTEAREEEGEDLKETYEIGRDNDPDPECQNKWPENSGDFRRETMQMFDVCKDLHTRIMQAIAMGLGIDEHWFDPFTDVGDNQLRLLHYPPTWQSVFRNKQGQVRAGAHSDYGSITLLFQDRRGGLQVQGPDGSWVDVKPIEGTIVVNAADLLMRWSNDLIKSTMHRVVEPRNLQGDDEASDGAGVHTDDKLHPARYSIAYFCNPTFDRMIETIPGTVKEGEVKKYEAVNSGDYLIKRLEATY